MTRDTKTRHALEILLRRTANSHSTLVMFREIKEAAKIAGFSQPGLFAQQLVRKGLLVPTDERGVYRWKEN